MYNRNNNFGILFNYISLNRRLIQIYKAAVSCMHISTANIATATEHIVTMPAAIKPHGEPFMTTNRSYSLKITLESTLER